MSIPLPKSNLMMKKNGVIKIRKFKINLQRPHLKISSLLMQMTKIQKEDIKAKLLKNTLRMGKAIANRIKRHKTIKIKIKFQKN